MSHGSCVERDFIVVPMLVSLVSECCLHDKSLLVAGDEDSWINPPSASWQGLKPAVGSFFIMMFTLMMVAYSASSMALAIAAGQSVVSVATLLMTISFVFMMVSRILLPWDLSPPASFLPTHHLSYKIYFEDSICWALSFKEDFYWRIAYVIREWTSLFFFGFFLFPFFFLRSHLWKFPG